MSFRLMLSTVYQSSGKNAAAAIIFLLCDLFCLTVVRFHDQLNYSQQAAKHHYDQTQGRCQK